MDELTGSNIDNGKEEKGTLFPLVFLLFLYLSLTEWSSYISRGGRLILEF